MQFAQSRLSFDAVLQRSPERMLRRGGNWGLSRRGAAPPDRGGRCPAEPEKGLRARYGRLLNQVVIRCCALNVRLQTSLRSKYHLNDAEPTVVRGRLLHRELPRQH